MTDQRDEQILHLFGVPEALCGHDRLPTTPEIALLRDMARLGYFGWLKDVTM